MNRLPIAFAVALVIGSPASTEAQEKTTEPTPGQVRRVDAAYAKMGATPNHTRNSHTGNTEYRYSLPATTTDDDLEKLPTSPFPFGLRLSDTKVTNKGLSKLKGLDTLNFLGLPDGFLTDEGLASLESAGLVHAFSGANGKNNSRPNGSKDVRGLNLSNHKITALGLRHLEDLTNLIELIVPEDQETDDMLRTLRKIGLLHAWRKATAKNGERPDRPKDVVNVEYSSKLTDAGLKELQVFVNLESLWLHGASVTPSGLLNLKGLNKINHISLSSEQMTDEALRSLQKIGLLHAMSFARMNDWNRRPTKADEVTHLELINCHKISDDGVGVLQEFTHLKMLSLSSSPITSAGVEKLVAFKDLVELKLPGITLTDAAVKVIAGMTELTTLSVGSGITAVQLKQLKSLTKLKTLDCGNLTDDKLRALREAGLLHSLEQAATFYSNRPAKAENVTRFDINLTIHTDVTPAGIKELGVLKNLRELDLGGSRYITDDMLKALREAGLLHTVKDVTVIERYRSIGGGHSVLDRWRPADAESVRLIELVQSKVTDEGLKELLPLKKLQTLRVGSDNLTGAGLRHLEGLKSLRVLELSGKRLSADGLRNLTLFPELTELTVGGCALSPDAVKAFTGHEKLTLLKLQDVRITEEGARELTRFNNAPAIRLTVDSRSAPAPVLKGLQGVKNLTRLQVFSEIPVGSIKELVALTSLTSLHLGSTHVTDDMLNQLKALKNLKWLEFQGGYASKEAIREFRAAMPGCRVVIEE